MDTLINNHLYLYSGIKIIRKAKEQISTTKMNGDIIRITNAASTIFKNFIIMLNKESPCLRGLVVMKLEV